MDFTTEQEERIKKLEEDIKVLNIAVNALWPTGAKLIDGEVYLPIRKQ